MQSGILQLAKHGVAAASSHSLLYPSNVSIKYPFSESIEHIHLLLNYIPWISMILECVSFTDLSWPIHLRKPSFYRVAPNTPGTRGVTSDNLLVLNVGNGWEWGLLRKLLIVSQWIIPEKSLRLAPVRIIVSVNTPTMIILIPSSYLEISTKHQ